MKNTKFENSKGKSEFIDSHPKKISEAKSAAYQEFLLFLRESSSSAEDRGVVKDMIGGRIGKKI